MGDNFIYYKLQFYVGRNIMHNEKSVNLYSPQKQLPESVAARSMITKRDFILRGNYFCEKYNMHYGYRI